MTDILNTIYARARAAQSGKHIDEEYSSKRIDWAQTWIENPEFAS